MSDVPTGLTAERVATTAVPKRNLLGLNRESLELFFAELGEPMPRGFWGTVWMIVRERARLWLRGRFGRPQQLRAEADVPAELLTRVDALSNGRAMLGRGVPRRRASSRLRGSARSPVW